MSLISSAVNCGLNALACHAEAALIYYRAESDDDWTALDSNAQRALITPDVAEDAFHDEDMSERITTGATLRTSSDHALLAIGYQVKQATHIQADDGDMTWTVTAGPGATGHRHYRLERRVKTRNTANRGRVG
jgi:hypothetical protein